MIAEVAARGDDENTVICIASDHGEMLGDHGDVDKSKPWEGSAHVPLMCKGPGIAKGKTVASPVATMDMSGTFIDYAGATPAAGMTTQVTLALLNGCLCLLNGCLCFLNGFPVLAQRLTMCPPRALPRSPSAPCSRAKQARYITHKDPYCIGVYYC